MDTFSEKELEQLKKLEQLRQLLQTILGSHVRLLIAVFVIILVLIILSVYLKATYSPVRYETQAMLHYYPKQTTNVRPYSAKFVLQMLTRHSLRDQFFNNIGIDPRDKKQAPSQISVTPIERNRSIESFKITLNAAKKDVAIDFTNAFADYCIQMYNEERIADLQSQKDDLLAKKQELFRDIAKLDKAKNSLSIPVDLVAPEREYERLRQLISEQRAAHTKLGLTINGLKHREKKLSAELSKYSPTLLSNEKELRARVTALREIDKNLELASELYTDENPKLIALKSRRHIVNEQLQKFLKEKQLNESDLENVRDATTLDAELKNVRTELESHQVEMRILTQELNENVTKFDLLTDALPKLQKINQQYAGLQDSLSKLDKSIADINYLLPLVKNDLILGERANSAYGANPFNKKSIVTIIFAALMLTGFLAAITVLIEVGFGRVSSERELLLLPGFQFLGSLPTSEKLFESKRVEEITFNAICHNFLSSETEHHIVLAGTLPGGKLLPELFDAFEWNFAMTGKRTLAVDMVLADNFDYEKYPLSDTGIIAYSGGKGVLPVASKKFFSPSEVELLKQDLQLLRKSYDLIFIRRSSSLRQDRLFFEQIIGFCDAALIAVGAKRTKRSSLRQLIWLQRKIKLPIMTILTDSSPKTAGKATNMEIGK